MEITISTDIIITNEYMYILVDLSSKFLRFSPKRLCRASGLRASLALKRPWEKCKPPGLQGIFKAIVASLLALIEGTS